jgi:hypothetical protein
MGAEPCPVIGSCSIDYMSSLDEVSDRLEIQQLLVDYVGLRQLCAKLNLSSQVNRSNASPNWRSRAIPRGVVPAARSGSILSGYIRVVDYSLDSQQLALGRQPIIER